MGFKNLFIKRFYTDEKNLQKLKLSELFSEIRARNSKFVFNDVFLDL